MLSVFLSVDTRHFSLQRQCLRWCAHGLDGLLVRVIIHCYQVAVPYVNHVPTLTGGVGYEQLARFYKVSEIQRGFKLKLWLLIGGDSTILRRKTWVTPFLLRESSSVTPVPTE